MKRQHSFLKTKKIIEDNFLSLSISQKRPHKLESISQQPDNVPPNCKNPCAVLNATSSPASITFSNKLVHKSDFALKTPAPGVKFTGENFHASLGFMKPLSERGTTFQTGGRNVVENWEKIKKKKKPSTIVVHFIESWRVIHLPYTPSPPRIRLYKRIS